MGLNTTRASPKQEVDRISNLPDAILCYILSFLSTKFSVRTRILSKRWKYLFTLVPVLDFLGPRDCYTSTTIQPFLEFVDFVVNSYNVDRMDRFSYSLSSFFSGSDTSRLFSWVQNIVNRRVQELMVLDYLEKPQTFPQNVFISKSLVVLKILANFNLDVPENAYLPRVRTIRLLNVIFQSDDSVRRLFRGCPVLEDLFLDNCNFKNIEAVDICVPSLLSLKISGIEDEYALVLDVPNVRYFEYYGSESRGFSANCGLKSLVNACVSFPTSFPIWSDAGSEVIPKLISIVSHVQHLSFCSYTLEAYRGYGHTFPIFHKLTCLDMRISATLDFDLGLLVDLLDKTPHLDSLFLTSGYSSEFEPSDLVPEHVPMCVSENLKLIEFRGFSMLVYEYTLVKYFLKNAKVLQTLYVQSKGSLEQQFEITKKLLTLRRCSKACQVFVDSAHEGGCC